MLPCTLPLTTCFSRGCLKMLRLLLLGMSRTAGDTSPVSMAPLNRPEPSPESGRGLLAGSSSIVTEMRMYRLVNLVAARRCRVRLIEPRHPETSPWSPHGSRRSTMRRSPTPPSMISVAMARRRVKAGEVHLWHTEGVPVALAGVSGALAGVARVGPVYTPPKWRRNGYGSGITAAATAAALGAGAQHVVLYTDLANPDLEFDLPDHWLSTRSRRRGEKLR